MASFSSIVVVNIREDGQPDLLQVIGENDTIADEVLSPEVRTAATKADEAITKANEVSGKNDEVSSYISTNETAWETGLDDITRADIVSLSTTVLDSSTGWEEGLDIQTYNDIVTTSNALVGFQNTSGPAIKLSYESNADVTPFTPASATKFDGIEAGATNNQGALADLNQVTRTEIASNAVSSDELATDAVTTDKIENISITTDKYAPLSITNAKIKAGTAIEITKLEKITDGTILGNFTGASAVPQRVDIATARTNLSSTPAQIKTAYESNADVAPFTPTSATKFDGIQAGAEVNVYSTNSEIKTAYESNADVAPFTTTSATKFDGIEAGATNNQGALADLNTITDTEVSDNAGITVDKLEEIDDGIILGNFTGDTDRIQKVTTADARASLSATPAQIKTAYETIPESYNNTKNSKLSDIEDNATADQTDSEIETAYNTRVAQVGEDEKTDGTETGVRRFSPKDIADMAGTHGGGGGGGPISIDEDLDMDGFDIVNADYIKGQNNGPLTFSSNDNTFFIAGPYTGGSVPASANVSIIADNVILDADPHPTGTGLTTPKIKLGKGLLLTPTSGVDISGAGGETVDDPPNGAALVYDAAASLFKWVRIGATNIGDGAILENNIADGAVGSDKLAANAATDNIATNGLTYLMFPSLPDQRILGNNSGFGGTTEQLTDADVRAIINVADGATANTGALADLDTVDTAQIDDDAVTAAKLADTVVTAGSYSNPTITVDAQGRLTSATGGTATPVIYAKRTGTGTFSITSTPASPSWDTSVASNLPNSEITFNAGVFTVVDSGQYRLGAYLTAQSAAGQRAQVAAEIYIDGVAVGDQRGGAYIRNAGVSYDYWAVEVAPEVFELTAGQTIEIRIGQVTGATYGYGGTYTINCHEDKSRIWIERLGAGEKGDDGLVRSVSAPDTSKLWYNTTDNEIYAYDSGRGHWLGTPQYISLGKTTSTTAGTGHYLYVGHAGTTATTAERGWLVPHDMVITGWRAHTESTFTGWTFRIDKNSGGTNTTGIVSVAPGAVDSFSNFTLDVDVAAGDILGVAGVTGSVTLNNSTVTIKVQRKGA